MKRCLFVFATMTLAAQATTPLMEEYNRVWIRIGQLRYDDEVVSALQTIIGKDKTFYRAYRSLAEVYLKRKEAEVGERYFRDLANRDASNELAHFGLGEVLRLKGDAEGAAKEYRICATMNPRSYICQDRMWEFGFPGISEAEVHKVRRDYFSKLLAGDPSNPVLYLELAAALGETHENGKALELIKRAGGPAARTGDRELDLIILDRFSASSEAAGGGYEQTLAILRKLLGGYAEIGDLEQQLGCRTSIAGILGKLGHSEEALASLTKILQETEAIGNIARQAAAHGVMARVYSQTGELDQAIAHYQRHDELRAKAGLHYNSAGYIASAHARRGEYALAIRITRDDMERVEIKSDRREVAHRLRGLGVYYMELGDYAKALDYSTQSVKIFQELGYDHIANAGISNIGLIYAALGDYSRAITCAEIGLKSGREHHDASEVQRNLGDVADIQFQLGNWKRALQAWDEALSMSPSIRNPTFDAGFYIGRSSAYERMGNYNLALRDAEAGLAIERRLHNQIDLGYALNRVGFLDLRFGHIDTAARSFQEALDLAERASLREIAWESRQGLGRAEERRGRPLNALEHYRKSIAEIEAIRGQNLAPELKVNFLQDRLAVFQDAVALLYRLHAADGTRGYAEEAFRIAEQSRARSFLDGLAESKAQVTKDISSEQRNREQVLNAAISQANARLLINDSPSGRAELKRAEDALNDWVVQLRNSDPRYGELHYPDPYTVQRVRDELLGDKEALVEYFVGETSLFAWVITKSSTAMIRLPGRRSIEQNILDYRKLITQSPASEAALDAYRASSQQLHAALVAPVISKTRSARRLLIIPDGILYYLPFETLLSRSGRFLVEDYTLSYAPSASVVGSFRLDQQRDIPNRLEVLAFGDPTFEGRSKPKGIWDQSPRDVVRSAVEAGGWQFPRLPMTRTEVNAIARLFAGGKSVVHLGSSASESTLKSEDLSRYKRIHFATHAVLDEQNPQRSGIVLSLPGTNGEDGILQPREIMNMNIPADLVVLSACQTALGKEVRGEGMVGLTRAFFYAGAPRVVVSLWKVDDIATSDLMVSFYRNLRRGDDVAGALRATKVAMIHSDVVRYRHPYFWAPFILAGTN